MRVGSLDMPAKVKPTRELLSENGVDRSKSFLKYQKAKQLDRDLNSKKDTLDTDGPAFGSSDIEKRMLATQDSLNRPYQKNIQKQFLCR